MLPPSRPTSYALGFSINVGMVYVRSKGALRTCAARAHERAT